jgi:glucosamine--fructose-6-phosphate aminotransferase (isomerizing)
MTEMILAEPGLARRLVGRLADPDGPAAALARRVVDHARAGGPIVVTGCGTSEHAAQGVAAILADAVEAVSGGGRWSRPISLQALEGRLDGAFDDPRALVIGISHEGATAATNRALEAARAAGSIVALITVDPRSPGAALADHVVATAELDQSWCHTVGYVSPLLAAGAVAGFMTGAGIRGLADAAADCLAAGLEPGAVAATERAAAGLAGADRIVVVASGVDRPAGRELVLKIEEGTHVPAAYRDLETVLHGHLAGIDPRAALVLVLADARARSERVERVMGVLAACRTIGVPVAAILAEGVAALVPADLTPLGRVTVPDPEADRSDLVPAAATLLATAVPLQLITERLARSRGVDPDPIRRNDPVYREAADAAG